MSPQSALRRVWEALGFDSTDPMEKITSQIIARVFQVVAQRNALRDALKPFAHSDLQRSHLDNTGGETLIVLKRGEAVLTIDDFRHASEVLYRVTEKKGKRYCPRCERLLRAANDSWTVFDCGTCEELYYEPETDIYPGQSKGKDVPDIPGS